MADTGDLKEEFMEQLIRHKEILRKNKIQIILERKRNPPTYQNVQRKITEFSAQEEMEVDKEDPEKKGHLDLSKHQKKHKRGKRCWICKSSSHLKRKCPFIRCFYCRKLGHIKADCHLKKINFIFTRLLEEFKKKEQKNIQKEKEKQQKEKDQKEMEKRIFQKRAQELEFKEEKKGEGEVCIVKWKGTTVGEFKGALPIEPIIENFKREKYDWSKINVLAEKTAPLDEYTLYEGLTHWCSCGENDMETKKYIEHLKESHKDMVLKNSQLNRPPWLDLVLYEDDQIEEKICYTEEDLELKN